MKNIESKYTTIGLNADKCEFLLTALQELITPLIGKEKFKIVAEKEPESKDITIKYTFE